MYYPFDLIEMGKDPYGFINLILFSFLMGGFLIYCFLNRKNTQKSYKEQIALLEARSLAAQMNPHFIFNVLNGLKKCFDLKIG